MNIDEWSKPYGKTCASSTTTSTEFAPPILLRRRLSAPETIMRKHMLAQQRSSSQDSHRSSESSESSSWTAARPGGSDSNLARRRNPDIRKSTLMKRFWESSKGNINGNFPSSYSEWQYSFRSKQGASPDSRSMKSLLDSPKHSRHLRHSPRRKQSTYGTTPKSDEDSSYVVYSSNLTESTEHTSRTEASDSYPISTQSDYAATNNPSGTKTYRINNNGISDVTDNRDVPSLPIKYQFVLNDKATNGFDCGNQKNEQQALPEVSKTNLNVITNVQLSQSTLNMIFNQVMQDVLQKPSNVPEPVDENILKQKAYNFNMKLEPQTEDNPEEPEEEEISEEKSQKFISKINAGSPYKIRNSPSVPRLSALPRTSSMEVNISSNDSLDKDSDNSLVDSLDDPASPRFRVKTKTKTRTNINIVKVKEKETNNDVSTQEDVFEEETTSKKTFKKSSVFYIPIDEKTESDSAQVVSDFMPDKLKEKLIKRQLKREEKRLQERLKSFDIENGNVSSYFSTSPDMLPYPNKKTQRKTKRNPPPKQEKMNTRTTLPQIDLKKDYDKTLRSTYTQRSLNKYRESVETSNNKSKSFWLPKPQSKQNKSTSSTKHIEILEIMEIVEPERYLPPKIKSKIPVLQNTSNTKLPKLKPKPSFLDFGSLSEVDPKLDQLIANILIDTLNHEDAKSKKVESQHEPQVATSSESNNNTNPKLIDQAADLLTKQVLDNNNLDTPKLVENMDNNIQTEDIPKGWITFYMLQKNQSPDSTSDEGPKTATKSTQYVDFDDDFMMKGISDDSDLEVPTSRRKLRRRSKNLPEGWSVTFSGQNHGEPAPEVEMKFKFPQLTPDHKIVGRKKNKQENQGLNFHDACRNLADSEIHKSKQYLQNPVRSRNSRKQTISSPRATKTSRQRTLLHRERRIRCQSFNPDDLNMPEVLSISGNALHQLRKLPKLNEQILKRLIHNLNQRNEDRESIDNE